MTKPSAPNSRPSWRKSKTFRNRSSGRSKDAVHSQLQSARMAELRAWVEQRLEINTEYSDEQVRMAIEKITVVDAETICVQFRYPGLEVEKEAVRTKGGAKR